MPKLSSELSDTQITPEPSLEKRTRRIFATEYKLRILAEANTCKRGELGAQLRREKLYSTQLSIWRRELADQGVAGLSKTTPGPVAARSSEQCRIEQAGRDTGGWLTRQGLSPCKMHQA